MRPDQISVKNFVLALVSLLFSMNMALAAGSTSIRQLPKGATIALHEGLNTSTTACMRCREGENPPTLWEAVGIVQFYSSDGMGDYDGIPLSSGTLPSQTDLASIEILQLATWKDPAGNSHEMIISKSNFGDSQTVREFRKIGEMGEPAIPGGLSYRYRLGLKEMASRNINTLFSLQSDLDDLSMFQLSIALQFPLKKRGGSTATQRVTADARKVMVVDALEPLIKMVTPPEESFPIKGTSGDPLEITLFTVSISDSNPNQRMERVSLSAGEEEQEMAVGTVQRLFEAQVPNPAARFQAQFSLTLTSDRQIMLPARGKEAKLTLSCAPAFPRLPTQNISNEYEIQVEDNDAPAITVKISHPAAGGEKSLTVAVKGGEKDIPASASGLLEVSLTGSGGGAGAQTPDPWRRGPGDAVPAQETLETMALDIASIFPDRSDWIEVPEDTRIFVTLSGTDNFDEPNQPGSNIVTYRINGKDYKGGRSALIFRDSGEAGSSLRVEAQDSDGNLRIVLIPFKVTDTRMNVQTIR